MKLKEARSLYYKRSNLASNSARQLAFAGIAVVWILATDNDIVTVSQSQLRLPLLMFVGALALDLLQYYSAAAFWGAFGRYHENWRDAKSDDEIGQAPESGNWVPLGSFWIKGILVAVGYVALFKALWPALFAASSG